MRSLIPTSQRRGGGDEGVVLVWVAVMITVLIGVGALVVDAGALYTERRQLQNGADAGALALAQDLAEGNSVGDGYPMADVYADANANDDASNVDEVCGSGPGIAVCSTPPVGADSVTGYVQVTTSTANSSGGDQVSLLFAPLLDAAKVGRTVEATAVAAWGPIGGAVTIPVTFSVCEFEALGGSLASGTFPSQRDYIYLHDDGPDYRDDCLPSTGSGLRVPGGFGWLDSVDCETSAVVGGWVTSDTGNNVPCDPSLWKNQELLIPIYDETQGSGNNAKYHVAGFAGFRLLGYKLGNKYEWNVTKCPDTTGNSGRCLYGEFTKVIVTGEIGSGGTDFGSSSISMIG